MNKREAAWTACIILSYIFLIYGKAQIASSFIAASFVLYGLGKS